MLSFKKIGIILLAIFSLSMKDGLKDTNAHYKAIFLYGFTKQIEWPQEYKDGNFVICILGNNPMPSLLAELNEMAKTYMEKNHRKLEIKHFTSPNELSKCHILYILPENSMLFNQAVSKLKGQSTLIITEKQGMVKQGAVINFIYVKDSKLAIELNITTAKKYNLKVTQKLFDNSIIVK